MKNKLKYYALIAIVFIGITVAFLIWISKMTGISFSWWSAQLTGVETIKSVPFQISASGQDVRGYSFVDAFGRNCTTVFASSTGSGLDCDYPKGN